MQKAASGRRWGLAQECLKATAGLICLSVILLVCVNYLWYFDLETKAYPWVASRTPLNALAIATFERENPGQTVGVLDEGTVDKEYLRRANEASFGLVFVPPEEDSGYLDDTSLGSLEVAMSPPNVSSHMTP